MNLNISDTITSIKVSELKVMAKVPANRQMEEGQVIQSCKEHSSLSLASIQCLNISLKMQQMLYNCDH
jgi:hypothetical protein